MRNQRQKQFKDSEGKQFGYNCTKLPALEANDVLLYLLDTLGRPVMSMLVSMEDDAAAATSMSLAQLFMRLTPESARETLLKVFASVNLDTKGVINEKLLNDHFSGELLHMYTVFIWALSVNFKDFLDVARGNDMLGGLFELAQGKASTLLTATPTSGESSTTTAT